MQHDGYVPQAGQEKQQTDAVNEAGNGMLYKLGCFS